jgi:hypothetical protein
MKNLKLGVLAFAVLGLALLVSDFEWFKLVVKHPLEGGAFGLCVIGGFALALLMGLAGVLKPPFTQQQALIALVGFALPGIKMRVWDSVIHIAEVAKDTKPLLLVIAIVGGVLVSALAMVKSTP